MSDAHAHGGRAPRDRSSEKADALRVLGADPVLADALDAGAMADAVARAKADVVIHQLTAIPQALDPRKLAEEFAARNRLRIEGTDILLMTTG